MYAKSRLQFKNVYAPAADTIDAFGGLDKICKKLSAKTASVVASIVSSCNSRQQRYVDLNGLRYVLAN
jgi:hypothetical protein